VFPLTELVPSVPPDLSSEALRLRAEVLSAQRSHEGGQVVSLTTDEWFQRWQAFHKAPAGTATESDHAVHGRRAKEAEAARNWPALIDHLDHLIAAEPEQAKYYARRGQAFHQTGDRDKALADYSRALELHPEDAELWFQRGRIYDELKRGQQAVEDYTEALARSPGHWEALHRRGQVYLFMLGQPERAAADFTQALQQNPKAAWSWLNRGTALTQLGKWDQALADYRQGFALDTPSRPLPWRFYASLQLLKGDTKGYQETCRRLVEHYDRPGGPGLTSAGVALVWPLVLGPDAVPDYPALVDRTEKVVLAGPKAAWNLYVLGKTHYRAGQFDKAIQRLHESIDLTPNWNGIVLDWVVLAMAHQRLGQSDKARQWFDRAVQEIAKRSQDPQASGSGRRPFNDTGDWLDYQILRREAEALLHPKAAEEPKS
jgi:tetratricopeptide (TPR) repeat protein